MSELNLSLQQYLTVSLVGSSTAMDLYLPIAREYQVGDRLNFVIKLSKVVEFYTLAATVELSMKTKNIQWSSNKPSVSQQFFGYHFCV